MHKIRYEELALTQDISRCQNWLLLDGVCSERAVFSKHYGGKKAFREAIIGLKMLFQPPPSR